jgi:hypothetical protein
MSGGPIIPVFARGRARLLTFDPRPPVDPLNVSIGDILELVADKDPRPIGHWRELSAEEYARSFAVARSAGYGIVSDIYEAFLASVGGRETETEFVDRLLPLLRSKGWLGDPGKIAPRLKLIFDTNLRVARASGRWERIRRTSHVFPYLRAVTARDERVRHPPKSASDHRAFDGIILPVEHAFWQRWFPPLGFRCRCSVIQMSRSQLARYPGGVTAPDDLARRESRLGEPIFAPPSSFEAQLAKVVSSGNDQRLPGMPALDTQTARSAGRRLLEAELISEGVNELADTLNRIFGIGQAA